MTNKPASQSASQSASQPTDKTTPARNAQEARHGIDGMEGWADPDDTDETPGWTPRASLEGEANATDDLDAMTDDPDFDDFEASLDLLLEAGSRADDADFERQDDGINEKGA